MPQLLLTTSAFYLLSPLGLNVTDREIISCENAASATPIVPDICDPPGALFDRMGKSSRVAFGAAISAS